MSNQEDNRIDVAMKLMKATDEDITLSSEEEHLLSDEETQEDLELLARAGRSLLESNVPMPDVDEELSKVMGAYTDDSKKPSKFVPIRNYIISAIIGAAAMLLIVFGFNYFKSLTPENKMLAQVEKSAGNNEIKSISTGTGETLTLNMSDGTVITLNADSRLDYPGKFSGDTRSVRLQGEALFKVSKDKEHPFIVLTEGMTTKVLGTTFDVKAYKGQKSSVTLIEGSVEVSSGNITEKIRPGERAVVGNNNTKSDSELDIEYDVNTDESTAWADNQFYFDDQRLEDIMNELCRWYNLKVVYKADSLKDLRLNFASPRNGSINDALELLNSMQRFKASKEGNSIVIE